MSTLTKKVIGLGTATLAAATIGVGLAAAPAQAFSFTDTVAMSGNANFIGSTNEVEFSDVFVESDDVDATGIFDGLEGKEVTVKNILFTPIANTFFANYSAVDDFLTFDNGIVFDLDAGVADGFVPNSIATEFNFTGKFFTAGGSHVGDGNFAVLSSGDSTSFNLTASTEVPEPLTILGSGLALGFGAMFKRQRSKKENDIA